MIILRHNYSRSQVEKRVIWHRLVYVKENKTMTKDSFFSLLYLLSRVDLEDEIKTRQKMYQMILFIVSHRTIFKYHACKMIRAIFEKRIVMSKKQKMNLNKWLILHLKTSAVWSNLDVTIDDSFVYELDSDCSWRVCRELSRVDVLSWFCKSHHCLLYWAAMLTDNLKVLHSQRSIIWKSSNVRIARESVFMCYLSVA